MQPAHTRECNGKIGISFLCLPRLIESNTAKFKGVGTIDGASSRYKFIIWADDDPDTFRIKIWEEVNGSKDIVYDNGSKQAITGGNIFIHKEKKK